MQKIAQNLVFLKKNTQIWKSISGSSLVQSFEFGQRQLIQVTLGELFFKLKIFITENQTEITNFLKTQGLV